MDDLHIPCNENDVRHYRLQLYSAFCSYTVTSFLIVGLPIRGLFMNLCKNNTRQSIRLDDISAQLGYKLHLSLYED